MSDITETQRALIELQAKAYRDGYADSGSAIRGAINEIRKRGYDRLELDAVDIIIDTCNAALKEQRVDVIIELLNSRDRTQQ